MPGAVALQTLSLMSCGIRDLGAAALAAALLGCEWGSVALALYYRSATSYQMHERIRCLYVWSDHATEPSRCGALQYVALWNSARGMTRESRGDYQCSNVLGNACKEAMREAVRERDVFMLFLYTTDYIWRCHSTFLAVVPSGE
jgi:hypothetical protein